MSRCMQTWPNGPIGRSEECGFTRSATRWPTCMAAPSDAGSSIVFVARRRQIGLKGRARMHDHARSDRWIMVALMLYGLGIVSALLLTGVRIVYGGWSFPHIWPAQRDVLLRNCVALTLDDGFYYFKIAQQIAHGAGSTFDGMHLTNGYHPLWLLCLTPIFWLTSAPDAALILGVILQGVLLALAVGLVYLIARLSFGHFAATLMGVLWVALTYKLALYGLEWGLHALGMLAVIYVYLRWFGDDPSLPFAYLGLGVLLGLTF